MNWVEDSCDTPKLPQNRTLWTIVILLRKKTMGYGIPGSLETISMDRRRQVVIVCPQWLFIHICETLRFELEVRKA